MRKAGAWLAGAFGMAVCACQAEAPGAAALEDAARPLVEFNPAQVDPDRPCTLIAARDAQALTGRPFLDTLTLNRIDGNRTRCALAVGEGVMQGAVQLDVLVGDSFRTPEAIRAAQCRPDAGTVPSLAGGACHTLEGGYAARFGERVFVASVRREPGQVNQALSLRLLDLVAARIKAATSPNRS